MPTPIIRSTLRRLPRVVVAWQSRTPRDSLRPFRIQRGGQGASKIRTMATTAVTPFVSWTVGSDDVPPELGMPAESVIPSTLIPRTVGWISVSAFDDPSPQVALLEGFTAAAYTPPTLFFAASALPTSLYQDLVHSRRCTVSAVTTRESLETVQMAATGHDNDGNSPCLWSMEALGLEPTSNEAAARHDEYPRAVAASPIHMYCTLRENVALGTDDHLVVLTVETFVVDGSVLTEPSASMITGSRSMTAKIDATLIDPRVGLGNGRDYPAMASIRSMLRPMYDRDENKWTSTDFETRVEAYPRCTDSEYSNNGMEWNFRTDGRSCPLGYNPVTALVMPRPIGWISTYSKQGRVEHLAPYSFFSDVARGRAPVVGFSAYRRDGVEPKDAQKDAEEMKCFCFNLVTHDLIVPMNYSAAELPRDGSEFTLAKLASQPADLIDAPYVADARVVYECEYVKTVDVETFSIVLGAVKRVHVRRDILRAPGGGIDVAKLRPVSRMGYTDEYGVLFE